MKNSIIILFVLYASFAFTQNSSPSITFKDGSTKQFHRISFEYNAEDYIIGVKTKTGDNNKEAYTLNEVVSVRKNDINFKTKQYKKSTYLFEDVIIGSLSLYKSGDHYFLENEEHGLREIPKVVIDEKTLNRFEYSTLTLFVNKCKEAQELAYNKYDSIILSNLKAIIETYNNCNLSEDTQFASNIIEEVNAPSETIEVGVNVGYSFLNTSFEQLSPGVTNNYGAPTIGAQIYFNTNMLKKNIGFILSVDYSFPEEFKSNDNDIILKSKFSYINTMIGVRYTFNNISETFSPYIGFNGGIIFNSKSYLTVQEAFVGSPFIYFETTNKLIYNVGVGSYIHFGKQKIDFNLTYLPENKFVLLSNNIFHVKESFYKLSGFQLKVSYVF